MENIPLGAINPRRWLVLTVVVAARQREIKRGRQGSKEGRRLPNADLQHSHKKLLMGKFAADSEPSSTNLPGPMFCWYVRNTYLEDNLRLPGKTVQCGVPVDLSLIDVPAFLYASRDDHIVPWRTAYASTELLAGDTTFVLGASGHIAGVINPASKNKRNHWINGASGPEPERWLATARDVPGSW